MNATQLDLAEWLETAISAVEERQNTPCNPGPARLTPCPVCGATLGMLSRIREPFWEWKTWRDTTGAVWHSMEPCNCPLTYDQWVQVVDAKPNPNLTVLRRCKADREILDLARRGIAGHPGRCVNYEGQESADYTPNETCERHIEWAKTALVHPKARELVLRALAEGYGYREEKP